MCSMMRGVKKHAARMTTSAMHGGFRSNLATRLVRLGADVTIVDSLLPQYGGSLHNVSHLEGKVKVNISDVRDAHDAWEERTTCVSTGSRDRARVAGGF